MTTPIRQVCDFVADIIRGKLARCALLVAALAGLALFATAARSAPVTFAVGEHSAASGERVAVPIAVRGAQGLGGVQFVLRHDPEILKLEQVEFAGAEGEAWSIKSPPRPARRGSRWSRTSLSRRMALS